jgi:ATP-dependent DNA ligase
VHRTDQKLARGDASGCKQLTSSPSEGQGDKLFETVCQLGLEGIVSKRSNVVLSLGAIENLDKVKNPQAPAATRAINGTF